ncbi:MAG: hypothetical protein JWN62_2480, partial [Acidimicrobiales bacterium]|nr:hypothetical protein [Acidimicrobiales bacterium]
QCDVGHWFLSQGVDSEGFGADQVLRLRPVSDSIVSPNSSVKLG